MAAKAIETAGSLDQATLDALWEGIAAVLAEQSSRTAVHAFIGGKNSLDRELWSQAASLGWRRVSSPCILGTRAEYGSKLRSMTRYCPPKRPPN